MSCVTPPTITNPFLYNEIISNFQTDLSSLTWIDDIFPLAEAGEFEIEEGNRIIVPMVLKQDGTHDYIPLFPDGDKRAGCFFELENGDQEFDLIDQTTTIVLNIIFYANLKRIANRVYDFTDELAATVFTTLTEGVYSSDITTLRLIKDKQNIYNKYGYSYEQLKQLSYPYTAFKFQISLNTDLTCIAPSSFDASFSPSCL